MTNAARTIEDWAKSNGYELTRDPSSTRLSLTFDSVRTHFHVLAGNTILLEARLCDLPQGLNDRERVLDRAMTVSAGRLRDNPSILSCDDSRSALWLQRRLPGGISTTSLDEAVEQLVNEIDMWRVLL